MSNEPKRKTASAHGLSRT